MIDSLHPILFTPDETLVIRPLRPQGFAIETRDGRVLFQTCTPFESVTFRLLPGPAASIALSVDLTWFEVEIK